jgi:DNA-binding MarR family transcriptional regulator
MTNTDRADQLATLFERIRSLDRAPAYAELLEHNLGFSHVKALHLISSHTEVAMKDLAAWLRIAPPSVTTLVRRLEEVGLVERVRSESDSRVWLLRLTPYGRDLSERMRRRRLEHMGRLLATLAPGDQALLLDLLGRAVAAAEREE